MPVTEIHFRDVRPPQEIQFQLERRFGQLCRATAGARLTYELEHRRFGATYGVRLQFVAALAGTNAYHLRIEVTETGGEPARSAAGWIGYFTMGLVEAPPPRPGENGAPRYAELVRQALAAEAQLTDVPAIQAEIVRRMKAGDRFHSAHKEGGTQILFRRREYEREGQFERSDYGESNETVRFANEADFLVFLRRYFEHTVSDHCRPHPPEEVVAWRLILRQLDPPRQ